MVHKRINVATAICRHKYTEDKLYPVVNFSYNGKGRSYPLARFLYAWFKGEVKDGEEVDHIDNDPFNNKLENLQVLTHEENLRKRFTDHSGVRCFNQFYNTLKIDPREPKVKIIGYKACQAREILGISQYFLTSYVNKGLIKKLATNRYCIEDVEALKARRK